jgi:hypothetical protein
MISIRKICFYSLIILFIYVISGCDAQKEMAERRNLMMPKKSELPRNSLYKEPSKKKTYKVKTKKTRKTKKLY